MPSEESKLVDLLNSVHDQATTLKVNLQFVARRLRSMSEDWAALGEFESHLSAVENLESESLELAQFIENRP